MPLVTSQYFIAGVVGGSGVVVSAPTGVGDVGSVADGVCSEGVAPVVDGGVVVVGGNVSGWVEASVIDGVPSVDADVVVVVTSTQAIIPTVI